MIKYYRETFKSHGDYCIFHRISDDGIFLMNGTKKWKLVNTVKQPYVDNFKYFFEYVFKK